MTTIFVTLGKKGCFACYWKATKHPKPCPKPIQKRTKSVHAGQVIMTSFTRKNRIFNKINHLAQNGLIAIETAKNRIQPILHDDSF